MTEPTHPNSSTIPKFFEKSREERLQIIKDFAGLSDEQIKLLGSSSSTHTTTSDSNNRAPNPQKTDFEQADNMIENAIGTFWLPLGIATNFQINNKDYLIPMVIEEPSVVAAASKAAKLARAHGGFTANTTESYSTGQIQIIGSKNTDAAISQITKNTSEILRIANSKSATLPKLGKGAKKIQCKKVKTDSDDTMLIVELLIDVGDAMGANITNTMCEAVAPTIQKLAEGGTTLLRILSNYSVSRMVKATATFDKDTVGSNTIHNILHAYQFAKHDVYRAVTHNKGIMNGIISVANATGQDSRAIEAAAHAYAAHTGQYRSLSDWYQDKNGNLVGTLEIPLSVGIVGGIINVHPTAKACVDILKIKSAKELACIMASAGLAQNFAAMYALVTDGIQKGHMSLHARNIASAAGAQPHQIDAIVSTLVGSGDISLNHAKKILADKHNTKKD